MKPGRTRWLLRLAVPLLVGLAMLAWALTKDWTPGPLAIENRSRQPIALLRITLGGQTSTFQDVPVGGQVAVPFAPKGDDRLTVEGRLADGTMIRGRFGRAAGGLVVLPGGQIMLRKESK